MRTTSRTNGAEATPAGRSVFAHPAFAFVVALWFAALFGLGSLILPPLLIEKLIVASGLPELIPAARPPLGFTARSMIALGATVGGAMLGFFAARMATRPARGQAPEAEASFRASDLMPRRPINAHEDLGSEGLGDAARTALSRRRALAMTDEDSASELLRPSPRPGFDEEECEADDPRRLPALPGAQPPGEDAGPTPETPLDLTDAAGFTEAEDLAVQEHPDSPAPAEQEDHSMNNKQFFTPPAANQGPESEGDAAEEPMEFAASAGLPDFPDEADEPAPSQAADRDAHEAEGDSPPADTAPGAQPLVFSAPAPTGARPDRSRKAPGGLEDIGLVQLVQRLGATIEKHREWTARQAQHASAEPTVDEPRQRTVPGAFDVADAGEAEQAMADYFAGSRNEPAPPTDIVPDASPADDAAGQPAVSAAAPPAASSPARPDTSRTMQRPLSPGHNDDDDEDAEEAEEADVAALAASFSLPLAGRETAGSPPAPAERPEAAGEARLPDYASLLKAQKPHEEERTAFVRIEEPEPEVKQAAVVFPGESQARGGSARAFDPPAGGKAGSTQPRPRQSTEETDRALREALLNLQRMGKAS